MAIQNWSEDILLVELENEPQFSDDLTTLIEEVNSKPHHAVLNFSRITYLNSSSIAKLIQARKAVHGSSRRMLLRSVSDSVWGLLLTSGLDSLFELAPELPLALASLQMEAAEEE